MFFKFIGDLISVSDGEEFESNFCNIYRES